MPVIGRNDHRPSDTDREIATFDIACFLYPLPDSIQPSIVEFLACEQTDQCHGRLTLPERRECGHASTYTWPRADLSRCSKIHCRILAASDRRQKFSSLKAGACDSAILRVSSSSWQYILDDVPLVAAAHLYAEAPTGLGMTETPWRRFSGSRPPRAAVHEYNWPKVRNLISSSSVPTHRNRGAWPVAAHPKSLGLISQSDR
jgi:hypothetical protein